jgi:hypothetical protein
MKTVVAPQVAPPIRASTTTPEVAGEPSTTMLPTKRDGGFGGAWAATTPTTKADAIAAKVSAAAERLSVFEIFIGFLSPGA